MFGEGFFGTKFFPIYAFTPLKSGKKKKVFHWQKQKHFPFFFSPNFHLGFINKFPFVFFVFQKNSFFNLFKKHFSFFGKVLEVNFEILFFFIPFFTAQEGKRADFLKKGFCINWKNLSLVFFFFSRIKFITKNPRGGGQGFFFFFFVF